MFNQVKAFTLLQERDLKNNQYRLREYGMEMGFGPLDQPKRVNQF